MHFRRCFLFLCLGFFACSEANEDVRTSTARRFIESIRAEAAPDKRVAVWQPELARTDRRLDRYVLRGETNLPDAKRALTDSLDAAGIAFVDSLSVLPDRVELGEQIHALVNLSVANIRSQPKHSAELATQATLGTPLNVLKRRDDWYYIQTPDGYLGWLDAGGLALKTTDEMTDWFRSERVVYLPDFGVSYMVDHPEDAVVSDVLAGAILQRAGSQFGVTTVRYPDGREADLPDDEVMAYGAWLASRQATAEGILFDAYQLLGRPYLWGGTSNRAMDCSGFTKIVFYQNGILLPRDASQQVHVGELITTDTAELDRLERGDLLFFGRKATVDRSERTTHVAIYAGNGRIIHASGRVLEESLRRGDPGFAEHRLTSFLRAKRILGSEGRNGVRQLRNVGMYRTP